MKKRYNHPGSVVKLQQIKTAMVHAHDNYYNVMLSNWGKAQYLIRSVAYRKRKLGMYTTAAKILWSPT